MSAPRPLGTSWRTDPPGHIVGAREKRADSQLRQSTRRAGHKIRYRVPDYASGDALADAVQASIARDLLGLLPDM